MYTSSCFCNSCGHFPLIHPYLLPKVLFCRMVQMCTLVLSVHRKEPCTLAHPGLVCAQFFTVGPWRHERPDQLESMTAICSRKRRDKSGVDFSNWVLVNLGREGPRTADVFEKICLLEKNELRAWGNVLFFNFLATGTLLLYFFPLFSLLINMPHRYPIALELCLFACTPFQIIKVWWGVLVILKWIS